MRTYISIVVIFFLIVTGLVNCGVTGGENSETGPEDSPDINEPLPDREEGVITPVDQVVYDHFGDPVRDDEILQGPWGKHEGLLHGVPDNFDWYHGARPSVWFQTGDNKSVSTWGQIYEWADGSPVTDVRVQIRNHMLYAYANGEWVIMENGISNGIEASTWAEDFSKSFGTHEGRDESGNGGGMSYPTVENRNIHWWEADWPRAIIPAGTEAFFVSCEIRLIHGADPNVNLSDAKYLAGVSADAYPETNSAGPGPWPSLSITRHKFLTPEWQSFTSYVAGPEPSTVEEYRNEIESRPLPPYVGDE
jgi:hypothetical protein